MAVARDDARRSVVPHAAGRSLWLAAVWTGVGAAVVCATLAIVAVAMCWLPVSGAHADPLSAVRAGLLSFLAALHGGVTIDGTNTNFAPLGMTCIVALTAWRAGAGLADAAAALDEEDPTRLVIAATLQGASFATTALIAVPFAHLGTSSAPPLGVGAGALLLFLLAGGSAFVRASTLREWWNTTLPSFVPATGRMAGFVIVAYLGAGALLVAGSLVMHASRVEELSRQVGGGWGSVPVLLLGLLTAPNAAIAGAAYLSGPGFTVGSGTTVGVLSTTHGVLPAFPILGAVPAGHGATWYVWVLVVVSPVVAGTCVARMAMRSEGWLARLRDALAAVVLAATGWALLSWLGGGGIGAGRLAVIGPSWWQVGAAVFVGVGAVTAVALGVVAGWDVVIRRQDDDLGIGWLSRVEAVVIRGGQADNRSGDADDVGDPVSKPTGVGKLAG